MRYVVIRPRSKVIMFYLPGRTSLIKKVRINMNGWTYHVVLHIIYTFIIDSHTITWHLCKLSYGCRINAMTGIYSKPMNCFFRPGLCMLLISYMHPICNRMMKYKTKFVNVYHPLTFETSNTRITKSAHSTYEVMLTVMSRNERGLDSSIGQYISHFFWK